MPATHPFIDTHVHFWDRSIESLGGYSWLDPGGGPSPVLGSWEAVKSPAYLPRDLKAETRFANVVAAIHVQAALGITNPVEETRWLQTLSDEGGWPTALIAAVDLTAANAREVIAEHAEYPCFRGVRDLRYDDYLQNPAWEAGFALLDGLVLCDDPQIPEMAQAAKLAQLHPGVTYCVDHAGFPKARDADYFDEWRDGMRQLAAVENTVVKISGLGMADHDWTVASIRPWVLECIESWGVDRAFFGTNWPLDRLFSSYADVVEAYRSIVADFSPYEQEQLLAGNARRVFRLDSL